VLDVHLMIVEPDRYLEQFSSAGADWITVHVEVCNHLHRTVTRIKELGKKAGVVLNPSTPLTTLDYILEDVDLVMFMSVNPGFGGQSFIPSTLKKITSLRRRIDELGLSTGIEVDGGISEKTIGLVAEAGANIFVAGSAIYGSEDYGKTISQLKKKAGEGAVEYQSE
jgi:ribulose-phosphate 3-epimerase